MTIALLLITALAAAWLIRQWWRAELDPPQLRPAPVPLNPQPAHYAALPCSCPYRARSA